MKKRSIPLYVILSIVTFGIFFFIWFYKVTVETIDELQYRKIDSPLLNIVFLILGNLFYFLWWNYKISAYLGTIEEKNKIETDPWSTPLSAVYGLVLHQSRINRIVLSQTQKKSSVSSARPKRKPVGSSSSGVSKSRSTASRSTTPQKQQSSDSADQMKNAVLGIKTKK